jgi:hypothetical protein
MSLREMIEHIGYIYFSTGSFLAQAKVAIERWEAANPHTKMIVRDDHAASWPIEVLGLAMKFAEKLRVATFTSELDRTIKRYKAQSTVNATELRIDIERTLARFGDELAQHHYKAIAPEWVKYYGQDHLFGDWVSEKFPSARIDLKEAGNCYALERPTACVFHLMRAMEASIQKLGRRLGIAITPQTTWRRITGEMDAKIKAMPEQTPRQKKQKDAWSEARANLHHVGQVWRNNTMHPARDYTMSQAKDVIDAIRVSMQSLCEI